ncbi:MAG: BrnT family toxin [Pyrinomonadaceae bacterium]
MQFVWDPDKAAANIERHDGVSFDEAVEAFYDEYAIEEFDDTHSTIAEKRFLRIGLSTKRLLVVVFVDLTIDQVGFPVYRIISARRAARHEQKLYEEFNQKE